jgi:hypothetical protein
LCAGLAAAAWIEQGEKHRSPTRNTPQPRAFRGTDAKEFPILTADQLQNDGVSPAGGRPEQFREAIRREIEVWRKGSERGGC